jgi:amidase
VDTHELAFAGAAQQARMLADGIITAPELLGVYLERIGRLDPELRSYGVVLADSAREAAAAAQTRLDAGERLPLLAVTWQPSTAWSASPAYPAWRRKDTHA